MLPYHLIDHYWFSPPKLKLNFNFHSDYSFTCEFLIMVSGIEHFRSIILLIGAFSDWAEMLLLFCDNVVMLIYLIPH